MSRFSPIVPEISLAHWIISSTLVRIFFFLFAIQVGLSTNQSDGYRLEIAHSQIALGDSNPNKQDGCFWILLLLVGLGYLGVL
jgi:hypothetical protein